MLLKFRKLTLGIGLIAVVPASVEGADELYHVTAIGRIPGSPRPTSSPVAINERTQMAGIACCLPPSNRLQAFIWDELNGMVGLGDLPGGVEASEGWAINNLGHVAGAGFSKNLIEAFLWTPENGMIPLGELPGGTTFSRAYGMNDLDQIVGQSDGAIGTGEAFLWDAQNGMIGLGDLPGGNFGSAALDINNAGQVCGVGVSERGIEAIIWDKVNGMRTLGNFPDGFPVDALAINELGQVTGIGATARGTMAYLWDPAAGIQWLGHLPGPAPASAGGGLNDRGQVVGGARREPSVQEAFIWDAANGMRSLNDLLDVSGATVPAGLQGASDINNRGQIAASDGVQGYLLTPFVLADMNCDDAVNAGDVDAFFLALVDYERYEAQYPDCHGDWSGDVNQDARFDAADIDAFFALLGG